MPTTPLKEIRETAELDFGGRSPWRELLRRHIAKIVGIGVCLAVLQQFCGINVIFNYAEEIYRAAGYGVSGVLLNIVATGAIGLAATLIAFALVDKFGSRPLMLFGCIAVGVLHVLIGFSYHFGLRGPSALAADSFGHWLLWGVFSAHHLGADRGDFSQSNPRHRGINRRLRIVDCLLRGYVYFPFAE